jgi:hypothetical protein
MTQENKAVLAQLAKPCAKPTKWPEKFDDYWEVASSSDWVVADVGCWASLALERAR